MQNNCDTTYSHSYFTRSKMSFGDSNNNLQSSLNNSDDTITDGQENLIPSTVRETTYGSFLSNSMTDHNIMDNPLPNNIMDNNPPITQSMHSTTSNQNYEISTTTNTVITSMNAVTSDTSASCSNTDLFPNMRPISHPQITPQNVTPYTGNVNAQSYTNPTVITNNTVQPATNLLESIIAQQQQQIQKLVDLVTQTHLSSTTRTVQPTFALPPLHQILPTFAGLDEEDPNDFVQKFLSSLQNFHLPEETWRPTLRSQLKGIALSWHDRNVSRFTNLDTFVELFKTQFDNLTVQTRLKAKFFGVHQTANESSVEFVSHKTHLYKRLFPYNSESQMTSDIVQLLHPTVQMFLLDPPNTMDVLLHKLDILDRGRFQTMLKPAKNVVESPKEDKTKVVIQQPTRLPKCQYCPQYHYHRDCSTYNKIKEDRLSYGRPNEPRGSKNPQVQDQIQQSTTQAGPPPNLYKSLHLTM